MTLGKKFLTTCMGACLATSLFAQGKPKNSDIENIGKRDINQGQINFISVEKEVAMGRQLAAEFERQNKVLENPAVNEYVNRLGQNIALNSDARIPLTFKVIETNDIDSKALPGGFVYVTTGMILAIDTEAELASVLAQEVAHIAARHGVENVSKVQLVNNASSSLASFVRQQVLEADYLGLQYLYKAGYTPEAANGLLRKIQVRIPGSEFPRIEDRIATNQKNIDLILPPRVQNTVTTPEFDSIKAQLR